MSSVECGPLCLTFKVLAFNQLSYDTNPMFRKIMAYMDLNVWERLLNLIALTLQMAHKKWAQHA